jgi:hypothetical protein
VIRVPAFIQGDRSQRHRLGAQVNMPTSPNQSKDSTQTFDYDVAMRRVIYLAVIGAVVVLVYSGSAAWTGGGHIASVFSIGLMAACAAIVSGGLLGFLCGVPHVREGEAAQTQSGVRNNPADSEDESVSSGDITVDNDSGQIPSD